MLKQEMQKTQNAKIISTLYVDERVSTITELAEKIETVFKLHLWKVVFSFSFLFCWL